MKKQKETVDVSQLPPVTETISSVILNFETNDKRLRLIESFYKMPEKELKMISREEIIQFAKEQKIYVDPAEGKKPAKGEPPIEHKPITSQELAKAAKLLIEENSVQYRKNKKDLLDNIENLKKQKEESIAYWSSQAEVAAKDPKKKPDKKTPPKPEEIIIPEIKEYDLEYLVVLYNYPLTGEEFLDMEKENIIVNNIREIKEAPDYVPPEEKPLDSSIDKKAQPASKKPANAPKEAGKPVNDAQILKFFTEATTINPEYTPVNIYNNLYKTKLNLGSDSKLRNCLFNKAEFSFRNLDDPKKTYYNVYQEEFISSMKELNEFLFLYKKWFDMHKFQEVGTPINDFSLEKISEFLKNNDFYPKDLEHDSVGNNLIAYFKSRSALEEEEKRINAERELEKLKREEEEKKQKLETQEEEQKKETEKKDTKKTSTGKKTGKEVSSKPDEPQISQPEGGETGGDKEKNAEEEIDTEGFNEFNQLFQNINDEVVREYDEPPLEENMKLDENDKNEEQKINEDLNMNNIENNIPEENSNIQQSASKEMLEDQYEEEGQEEFNGEENMENMSNELESSGADHFKMNDNMKKQAEELLEQELPQEKEKNNKEVNINENEEEKNNEEEKKDQKEEKKQKESTKVIAEKENEESGEASQLLKEQHLLQDKAATLNQNFDQQNLMHDIDNLKNENIKEEEHENTNEINNEENQEKEGKDMISPVKKTSENQEEENENLSHQNEEIINQNENNEIHNELDDNATENLDYERLIINENDEMMKNSLESKNEQNYLYHFEKSLNKSRAIPGIYRPPTLSPMEENLRKAVRAKVYPFLPQDVSIPIYEKYNLIHKFEECMKGEIPEREFDFSNRIYQENLSHDILTQRISKLLLYSPEIKTYYNENTDNMLLMLYYNIPKERVFRKYNKYRYLSKPDFDNWVKFFKPVFELKKAKDKQLEEEKKEESQHQELPQNPNSSQLAAAQKDQPPAENNVSAHIQEGSVHEGTVLDSILPGGTKKVVNPYIKLFQPLDTVFSDPLYISSDTYIGVVKEKIKYMFPSDNGLFIKKILENGIFSSYSSFVIKDDMIFGIRKDSSKNTEFWYRYDIQGTGLSISKNEEGKIFSNFTFVNGLNLQILPNGEVSQRIEGKNNYRVITSKASIIEYITDNEEKKSMNIYYANGNYSEIKDGKIKNINNKGYQTEKNLSTGEINVLEKIPVTVQMDIESQTSTMIREDGVIKITYSDKSSLTLHKDTTKIFTDIPDKNNNFKYMIEHDEYCTINVYISGENREYDENIPEIIKNLSYKSKDGIVYEIICPDRNKIYVFKDTSDNCIILIMNMDGGIIKIDPNNEDVVIISPSEVNKFGENKNELDFEIFAEKNAHKPGLYSVDFTNGRIYTIDDEQNLFEIYDDGYANCNLHDDPNKVIIEEKTEQKIENKEASLENNNESKGQEGANNPIGTEPNAEEENKTNSPRKEKNILERPPSPDYEKLNEENIEQEKKPKKVAQNQNLNQSANNNQVGEKKSENLNTSNMKKNNNNANNTNNNNQKQEGENNEEEKVEEEIIPPPTKNFIIPRLFVVENDNSGYELLNEEQIENYKKIKKEDTSHCNYISQVLTQDYTSHSWITKYFSIADGIKETHHIHNIQIPEILNKFCHLPKESEFVSKEIYFYRNLIESKCNYNTEFRQKIKEAIEASNKHFEKKSLEWYFGSYMNKEESKNAFEEHQNLLTNILNERQNPDVKFNYDKIRKKNPIKKNCIELKEKNSVLFDIKKYVKEKDDKKIREDLNFRIYPLNLRLTSPTEIEAIVNGINVVPPKAGKIKLSQRSIPASKRQIPIESHAEREVKFYPNYFESEKGLEYLKENPHQKYVDQKEKNKQQINVEEERDNISKAQNLLDKAREDYEQQRLYGNGDINSNNIHFGNDVDVNNKNNSPVVYLNNGPQNPNLMAQGSTQSRQGMGVSTRIRGSGRKVLPSIYKQTQILNRINDEYNVQKAREWVESKTMKYTVDGNLRKQNPLVPQYIKPTFPQAEFNEDYIYIDKLTEPRVKTSSVSNRVYFNAPSVEEIRKSGQHDLLIEAIENRRTPEEMMERLNLMITGELCDPLNKQLKIDPVSLDFGLLCQGKTYQMYLKLRNDDNMTNRVMVRNSNKKNYITIENFVGGKVVPGETKKVKVVLRADEEIVGKYNEILEITTKSFIYKIPIKAYIVKPEEYDEKRFGHLKGRELYTKSYPASDAKYKCDPIKVVLPKIRELEEKEKRKLEGGQGYNGSISGVEGDMNGNQANDEDKGNDYNTGSLPPI